MILEQNKRTKIEDKNRKQKSSKKLKQNNINEIAIIKEDTENIQKNTPKKNISNVNKLGLIGQL